MKTISTLILGLCIAFVLVAADEDREAGVRSKIVALEKAWNQAYKMGDTKSLDAILDDHMVLINDDGSTQSKELFLASVRRSTSREEQVSPESMSVHVYGTTAIATGVFRAKGLDKGKPYTRRERFIDTWILKDGQWVCVGTNATPILH
jgi:ketosteroid isomerase-like protein